MIIAPVPARQGAPHGLRSAYVEQCWTCVLGPTSVALLRLLPAMWTEQAPAHVDPTELARALGLPNASRVYDVAKRLAHFGHASWDPTARLLQVQVALPPLTPGRLSRAPEWVRARHGVLDVAEAVAS